MLKLKPDDLFISRLVEETYEFVPDEETSKSPTDLYKYFQTHEEVSTGLDPRDNLLFSYFNAHDICFSPLKLESHIRCYRAEIGETTFEFPTNWGTFRTLADLKGNSCLYLSKDKDTEVLGELFSEVIGYPAEVAFILHDDRLYISFIREGNAQDLSWICRYLGLEDDYLMAA